MAFQFNPPEGYRNVTVFPTKPANETAFRDQMMSLLDQLTVEINTNLWGNDATDTRSAVGAVSSVTQNIAASTLTKLQCFGTREYDNLNEFAAASEFTASKAGIYVMSIQLESTAAVPVGSASFLTINVNGGSFFDIASVQASSTSIPVLLGGVKQFKLSAGDVVSFYVDCTSAMVVSGTPSTAVQITRIA